MPKYLTIDVYSDIACPWCFIGTRRLASVLEEIGPEVEVEVRHHPYLLNPGAPPEGVDLQGILRERYGADPRPMFARVEAAAREAGIPLDLSVQPFAYDTTAAHSLLRHASERGTQEELTEALFVAYFLEGRNVSDPAVLTDVATRYGFTAEEVERIAGDESEIALTRLEAGNAAREGVRGVPFFILNNRFALSGAQPPEVFRHAIGRSLEAESAESAA